MLRTVKTRSTEDIDKVIECGQCRYDSVRYEILQAEKTSIFAAQTRR